MLSDASGEAPKEGAWNEVMGGKLPVPPPPPPYCIANLTSLSSDSTREKQVTCDSTAKHGRRNMDARVDPSEESPLEIFSRKGLSVHPASIEDAASWLAFLQALDQDTNFMMFEPGERSLSVDKCEDAIRRINRVRGAILMLFRNEAGDVVGYMQGDVLPLERKAHVMSVSCALLSVYRGDAGKAMFQHFFEEIEREGVIKRIEGVVMANNVRMLTLALSLGGVVEGMKRGAVKLKSGIQDEYIIAKYFK